jgi:hypothetical protein
MCHVLISKITMNLPAIFHVLLLTVTIVPVLVLAAKYRGRIKLHSFPVFLLYK